MHKEGFRMMPSTFYPKKAYLIVIFFLSSVNSFAEDVLYIGSSYTLQSSEFSNNNIFPQVLMLDSVNIDLIAAHENLQGIFFSLGLMIPFLSTDINDDIQTDSSTLLEGCFGLKANVGYYLGIISTLPFSLSLGIASQLIWVNYSVSQDAHDFASIGMVANLSARIKLSDQIYLSPQVSGCIDGIAIGGSTEFTASFYDAISFNGGLYLGFLVPPIN